MLAHAVAEEMQKVYQNELGPKPVPLTVPGEAINDEDVSIFFSICLLSTRNPLLHLRGRGVGPFVHIPCTWVLRLLVYTSFISL